MLAGDAAPVTTGDRVIVSEAAFTIDGLDAHIVNCFQLSSGKLLWQTLLPEQSYVTQDISDRYPVRPLASCAISGNRVFAVGFGGSLYCLDIENGLVIWQKDLVTTFGATPMQFGFASSPWCDERQVVVACGGKSALVISLAQDSGEELWKLGCGELGYGGFCQIKQDSANDQKSEMSLAYMARDEVIAFNPNSGKQLWSFKLPKRGLTNAVTPLAMPDSQLLIGGQGADGCIMLDYSKANMNTPPKEIWSNHQAIPFYCNWLTDSLASQVISSAGMLRALNPQTGDIVWKKRGWTDANFACSNETLIGVRGDGMAATAKWSEDGLVVESAQLVAKDRVWAPPVLVGRRLLVRGRNSISCVNWTSFPKSTTLPSGTEIDAMMAMYGTMHEQVEQLRTYASKSPDKMSFSDYERVANERSVFLGEGDFISIIDSLETGGKKELAAQIATAWVEREPFSLPAFERLLKCKASVGNTQEAQQLSIDRRVAVTFSVTAPDGTPPDAQVYVTGNTLGLGNWEPKSLRLERQSSGVYTGTTELPKGDLQFKCTLGSWQREEKRTDGRSISNRRRRIVSPCTISVKVAAWAHDE